MEQGGARRWSLTRPGRLDRRPLDSAAASDVQGQRCAERLRVCVWMKRKATKVSTLTLSNLGFLLFLLSFSQMGYSGDGPDRPWFGF